MRKRFKRWALSSKIRGIVALILIMQSALLLMNNIYSYKVVTDSTVKDQKNTLAIYLDEIRSELKTATSVLNELASEYMMDETNYSTKNELKKYLATMEMATTLNIKMANNPFLECTFFSNRDNNIYLSRFNSSVLWKQKFSLDDYIKGMERFWNDAIDENWHIVNVQGTHYLIQAFRLNHVAIGAMIRLDKFLQKMEKASGSKETQYIFSDESGKVLALGSVAIIGSDNTIPADTDIVRNYQSEFFVVSQFLGAAPIRLSIVRYRDDIYSGIDLAQYLLIAFGFVALFAIVISSLLVNRNIVIPLKKLFQATKEVEKGNLDFRITESPTSMEYEALIVSFNNMVKEINTLKISSYEEKLEKHKAELKYLQMQLQPHFYLNAISTISSLSMQNKNKEIKKFIMALSQYLRYLFTDNLSLVTVKNEIDHAIDFINLQQIKYPHMIFYMVDIDEEAVGFLLPKLMIQTFIENIFKHAFDADEMLSIFIKTQVIEWNQQRFAQITIEDNGDGFDAATLRDTEADNRERIGIENVRKTLSLTFGRDDLISLSNREEGGARVMIRIPEKTAEGEEA